MNEIDEAGLNPASDLNLDPRAELERLIVDCTCDWCGKSFPAGWDEEHRLWVPSVTQEWRVRVEQKPGYISKMYAYWRICAGCRLGDEYSFSKWVFPIIKSMPVQHDLLEQLIQVQPMPVPAGEILYMDSITRVCDHREAHPEGRFERVRRQAHADLTDAFLGALAVSTTALANPIKPGNWKTFVEAMQERPLRGRRAHGIVLDDANWRLDANPGEPNL